MKSRRRNARLDGMGTPRCSKRWAFARAAGVAAFLIAGCAGPRPSSTPRGSTRPAATTRPHAESIIFSSNRGGPWAIWTVKPDGSQLRPLTRPVEGEMDVDPSFSPDGASILFTSTRGGMAGVWRMGADASGPRRICDGEQAEWSPDGQRIVFWRAARLLTRDLATGEEKIITPEGWGRCSGPAWSPDGRHIAFAVLGPEGNTLYLVPAGGGEPLKVYDKEPACEPHWSPDGATLVYETESHLCTIRPDGTRNRLVTYYGGVQRYARFSPDGTRLVFCQAPSPQGPYELYIVPAAGGEPVKLTEGGSDMYPDWK